MTRLHILLLLCALACVAHAQSPQRIVVSPNHRFLQHTDGTPFFWLGDTAWHLFIKLDREEVERYLENRRQKGFTVIQAVALLPGLRGGAYGAPFIDSDPMRPTVDFWNHIDWVIDLAAKKGIYVAMLPCWGRLLDDGTLNAGNAVAYVKWLGARYGRHPNLFWILGGDTLGDRHLDLWNAMGTALKEADPSHLITFHPFGRTQSSRWFHSEPWLDFNMFQSGHRRYDQDTEPGAKGEDNWRYVAEDYAKKPLKPTVDGEPSYEGIPQGLHDATQPYWKAADARRYAYWSVFAGALGHTYGDNAVFQMHKPGDGPGGYAPKNYWYEAIDDPGAGQMQHLKHLMLSRPFLERIPDQSVIAGENGVRYDYVIATRGNSYCFAYAYTARPFDVQLGVISGKRVRAWWYDPRTGSARQAGVFANQGVRRFTPPGKRASGNDWVLVLDDESKRFQTPGSRAAGLMIGIRL
jgi:hypothetical protein